jgi:hypothetical protein
MRNEANSTDARGVAVALIARIWHWLTTTPYTRLLEAEVERLRSDNIALRASVFGLVGRPAQTYAAYLARQIESASAKPNGGETKRAEPARRHLSWAEIRKRLEQRDAQGAGKQEVKQ